MSGPHTQAGGFNFAHSQLDSQPNYSFADLTQDGTGYGDFSDFSGLTQVSDHCTQGHAKVDVPRFQREAVRTHCFNAGAVLRIARGRLIVCIVAGPCFTGSVARCDTSLSLGMTTVRLSFPLLTQVHHSQRSAPVCLTFCSMLCVGNSNSRA